MRKVEVAIIGAGSAGLAARSEVARVTDDYVVIDDGPLGTTCARVGCMPSKVLIQVANDFHRRRVFDEIGISGASRLSIDPRRVMAHVRRLRDSFTGAVVKDVHKWATNFIAGRARFLNAQTLAVGDQQIRAKSIVVATGSTPAVPAPWRSMAPHIFTTDSIFEQETLPDSMAVIGLGPIGIELGQALSRLGVEIVAAGTSNAFGGLSSPTLQDAAFALLSRDMRIVIGKAELQRGTGSALELGAGGSSYKIDAALIAVGRKPNLTDLGLEELGLSVDERGLPHIDPTTMRLDGSTIYIAGDASGDRAIFHEAIDGGQIAGYNAARSDTHCFRRAERLGITFSDPNIAVVGKSWRDVSDGSVDFVTGTASFEKQGRAIVMQANAGMIEIYADRASGRLLGAEMIAPHAEHLAHYLALALASERSVHQVLSMPFYHPTLEEGIRTALKNAAYKLEHRMRDVEVMRCTEPPASGTI